MAAAFRTPPGYFTKAQAAQRLGISIKTLDRRQRTEPMLARVLRIGRKVLFPIAAIEGYFRHAEKRGSL